jgi:hypothetical protein
MSAQDRVEKLIQDVSNAREELVTNRARARKKITDEWTTIIQYAQKRMADMLEENDVTYNSKGSDYIFVLTRIAAMNLIFQLESLEQAQESFEKGLSIDNEQLLELEEQNKESCNVTMDVNINTKMLLRGLYPQKEHVTFSPQSFVYKYEVEDKRRRR